MTLSVWRAKLSTVQYLSYTYRTSGSTILFKGTSLYLIEIPKGPPFSLYTERTPKRKGREERREGGREGRGGGRVRLLDHFGNRSPLSSRACDFYLMCQTDSPLGKTITFLWTFFFSFFFAEQKPKQLDKICLFPTRFRERNKGWDIHSLRGNTIDCSVTWELAQWLYGICGHLTLYFGDFKQLG